MKKFSKILLLVLSLIAIISAFTVVALATDEELPKPVVKYENDFESPFWYSDGREPTIPCCSNPDYRPSELQVENFKKRLLIK